LTLSNGKYQEFHDLEDVVEIGSILYNTQTNQIVGFVQKDSLAINEYMTPHLVSRWMCPDPLSEEYSSWSPYNYTMNNPIKYIDPNGMYASPYFDEDGNFLGVDENGYEGEIYITDKTTFDEHSEGGVAKSSEIQEDDNTKSLKKTGSLSAEAQSNIYTHVLNQMDDIDFSNLHNGKVSIREKTVQKADLSIVPIGFNDPDNYPRLGAGETSSGAYKITATSGEYSTDLYTVESIQNYLGVHEYYGHKVKGYSGGQNLGGTHWKAYREQMKHPTYKKLPGSQRSEIMGRMIEYLRYENPSLYNKLMSK
ncbi:hypothetical protein, partial [Marinifilum sp. D737]|uniref:hypothetical protein n=1 Tax=Marinifilum sp. D737 TaxID=2969628 RepID=UPI002275B0BA|nr:hypothetical protein [Marinifilum sp. D737]